MDEMVIIRDSISNYTIGVFDTWEKADSAKEKYEKDHGRKVKMTYLTKNMYYDPISRIEIVDFGGENEEVIDH